ncbi:MAG: hypothetical protein M1829_004722 [Trizodia sp. TS-e1964]|nr:MAG: hypothetical protein M1829_004722 [Trizodia sp. TS-e1964]
MNGIIHNCTHSDSDSATHRVTEDKMFIAIFNYIEHLFGKIKPQKLFFMAIDGVAPRAKMNQQRARRFRTALDAEKARDKAIREGVEMPTEEAFDSNCITPGTEFMAKLTKQLKYFINKKVSEDVEWQGVEIVLSGHEVPGEGEHKIMEYIRLAKAQPVYDPNTRHCLYGLDADLIMLGLLSHDPHFCLLREEVTFGRQNQKKSKELEHQNFYLMHLCIVREYLELEFQELKEPGVLDFPFDLEHIIDDFILMAFFVGNDFLPNLPNLHINEGALALMFKVYKTVLPKAGGFINDGGVINLPRLSMLLDELANVEYRFFEAEISDASWFKGKQMAKVDVMEKANLQKSLVMSSKQKVIFKSVKSYVQKSHDTKPEDRQPLDLPPTLPAADRKFVEELAESLRMQWKTVSSEDGERHLRIEFPDTLNDGAEDEDEEANLALLRVLKKYEKAPVLDRTAEQTQEDMQLKYEKKFQEWKDNYYIDKFGWGLSETTELRNLAENYVQGLQWVLYYYYRGVASWPWFYAYHYSPMISDVKMGLEVGLNFDLGQPFHPYQQLMGVLPDRSKKIVPEPYHILMTSKDSPIIDFYPREFELDMNGKRMEWEAVVKIPFIDEKRLLKAMAPKDRLLSQDEMARNEFGVSLKFSYAPNADFVYPSSLPGIFPDIAHCRCMENIFELPTLDGLHLHVGLMEGAKLGLAALAGFPSLKTLPNYGALAFHGVNVFQQDSRNESMVITLTDTDPRTNVEAAKSKLGQTVHIGYPFLQEAKVVKVSDELFEYKSEGGHDGHITATPHPPYNITQWKRKADHIENTYSKRLGIIIGPIESLIHVAMLKGLKMTADGATIKEYAEVPGVENQYASQVVVDEVISQDQRFLEKRAVPFEEEYPIGSRAFFLGEFNYGRPLEIIKHVNGKVEIWVSTIKGREPEFGHEIVRSSSRLTQYTPSYQVARMLHLNPLVLSKVTSSFSVSIGDQRLNLGLNLKFESKKLKVLGYSRREANGWEFSAKAIDLIQQYMINFPEFIAGIQRNPQGNIYNATDFYTAAEAPAKIKEITAWLKQVESKSFEKVPLEAEQLDSDAVYTIEAAADRMCEAGPAVEFKKIRGVPRNALLKPSDAEQRLGNQKFKLGDRVVYVQESGRVPIATRGTVVGVTHTTRVTFLDVVFDVTFMSGTSLGDRCSPFRGSTVPKSSVLNISDRQMVFGTKASSEHQSSLVQQVQDLNVNTPSQSAMGQFVAAPAPKPLRGSFKGAVTGSQQAKEDSRQIQADNFRGSAKRRGFAQGAIPNGSGRGRGGFNVNEGRGGSHNQHLFRGGAPSRANVYHPPQSYNNVPPPASLEPQGRGNHNGNFRGNFRGRSNRRGPRPFQGRGQNPPSQSE